MSLRAVLVALVLGSALGWLAWGGALSTAVRSAAGGDGRSGSLVGFGEIASIRVTGGVGGDSGNASLVRDVRGAWRVAAEQTEYDTDTSEVMALLRVLASVSPEPATGEVAASPRRVTVGRANGEDLVLRIGGSAGPGRVLTEVGGRVATIDASAAEPLTVAGLMRARSRDLVGMERGEIDRVRLETESGSADLRRGAAGWALADEGLEDARVVQAQVTRLLDGVSSAEVGAFDARPSRGGGDGDAEPGWDVTIELVGNGEREVLRFDVDDSDTSGRVLASVTRGGRTEMVRTAPGWFEGMPSGALGFVDARPVPWSADETGSVRLVDSGGTELVSYERTLDGWVDGFGDPVPESGVTRVEALLDLLGGAARLDRAEGSAGAGLRIEVERLGGTGAVRVGVVEGGVVVGGVVYGVELPGWVTRGVGD